MIKADTLKKYNEKRRKHLIRKTYRILKLKAGIEILKTFFNGRAYCIFEIDSNLKLSFFILKKKLEAKGFKCNFNDWMPPILHVSW